MTAVEPCQARPSPDGQIRCRRCRIVWDKDDAVACQWLDLAPPVQPEKVEWKSGLPELIR